jgi:hypothetical protein
MQPRVIGGHHQVSAAAQRQGSFEDGLEQILRPPGRARMQL